MLADDWILYFQKVQSSNRSYFYLDIWLDECWSASLLCHSSESQVQSQKLLEALLT